MSFCDDFRYIKSQIEAQPELLASSKLRNTSRTPVITRTQSSYLSELPPTEDHHSQRLGRTTNSGFFAPKHQPYRTFGTLHENDVFEWIALHFDIQPPPCHHPIYQSKNLPEQEKRMMATRTRSNAVIQVSTSSGTKKSRRLSLHGGLSSIHLSLGVSERRQMEVSAESCYNDTVERERLRKQYAEEAKLPKKFCKYGSTIEVYNPSIYLSSMVHKTSSKCCLVSHQPDSTSTAKNEAASRECQDNLEPVNPDEMTTRIKTTFPNFIVALAASHFKNRKLSSRKSSTNALQLQYLIKLQTIYSLLCCIHNIKSKDLKRKDPLSLALLNYLSQRPYHSSLKDVTQDFGHSQSTRSRSSGTTMAESKQPMKSLESHGTEHGKRWSDVIEKELPRSIPPWQMQIVYVEEKRKEDLHQKMQTCYEAFQQSKDELSQKTKAKLEERERISSEYLLTKLQVLKYGANTDKELSYMREKAQCIYVGRKKEKDSLPKWFMLLEQEVRSALNGKLLKDGHNLLKKLKQFTVVDTSTAVSHVLEKLCLVVMSIPAHRLCTEPVIGAVKFVLENILQSSPKLCKHWLEMRRLPWQHD